MPMRRTHSKADSSNCPQNKKRNEVGKGVSSCFAVFMWHVFLEQLSTKVLEITCSESGTLSKSRFGGSLVLNPDTKTNSLLARSYCFLLSPTVANDFAIGGKEKRSFSVRRVLPAQSPRCVSTSACMMRIISIRCSFRQQLIAPDFRALMPVSKRGSGLAKRRQSTLTSNPVFSLLS
jgi:hypothetical protein